MLSGARREHVIVPASPDFAGMSPVLEEVLLGSKEEIKEKPAQFSINDQKNVLGQSALHLAVLQPRHLDLILNSGADLDSRDQHLATPLIHTTYTGNLQVSIKLIDAGPRLKQGARRGSDVYLTFKGSIEEDEVHLEDEEVGEEEFQV